MIKEDIDLIANRGLALLRPSVDEWDEIQRSRLGKTRFSLTFPHKIARSRGSNSLVLIDPTEDQSFDRQSKLSLGLIKSVHPVSTLDSRIVFDFIEPIQGLTLNEMLVNLRNTPLQTPAKNLLNDPAAYRHISDKLGRGLLDMIVAVPENAAVLQRIRAQISTTVRYENAYAMQLDAVNLALKFFGGVDGATAIDLPGGETALATIRLLEDDVIEQDARWVAGWEAVDIDSPYQTGRALFRNRDEQLEIITANKRPLEELFGVDLIYFNRTQHALVMVQYKMMEPMPSTIGSEKEWNVKVDRQFRKQLQRMATFSNNYPPRGAYRLNNNPFYFKLVKRCAKVNAASIVLSKDHINQIIDERKLLGPRGGLRIGYKGLGGHYLTGSAFVELVRSGYIGTASMTTDHFYSLINATLSGGRPVVAALQSALHV